MFEIAILVYVEESVLSGDSELDSIAFDRGWLLEWQREKLHIHPRYYKDLLF